MDFSKIKIEVENDETWRTPKGAKAQRLQVHGMEPGSKYPIAVTRLMDDPERALSKGVYTVGGLTIDWGKITVDYSKCVPVAPKQ